MEKPTNWGHSSFIAWIAIQLFGGALIAALLYRAGLLSRAWVIPLGLGIGQFVWGLTSARILGVQRKVPFVKRLLVALTIATLSTLALLALYRATAPF